MNSGMRRLPLLTAMLALMAGMFALVGQPSAHASYSFSGSQIVSQAESYPIGYPGGQCKVWAAGVINAVLAANGISARVGGYGSPGGAYYGAYQNAGGTLISASQAQSGDLVQFINAAQKNSDYPSGALHTTILVSATSSPGTYVVRDSNWNLDGKVNQHTMNPVAWAASRGVTAYFWRFGTPGNPDLWFIKTKNAGSGHVEIHSATAASGYESASMHAATWFSTADANNGWFQMVGDDLYFIKTRNTGSNGHVEVHSATASSGYQAASVHSATWFGTGDQNNGWFQMDGA